MISRRAFESLLAFTMACLLVFGVKVQEINIQPLLGTIDGRWFHVYTPYFPGLDHLEDHEIFSPRYAHTKKIVLLGSSATDSIGCDKSWSETLRGPGEPINASYSCSITAQLNKLLPPGWHAFNLARNGAELTSMLYVYAQIAALKPEIVIYGDTGQYYRWNNAGADALTTEHYVYIHEVLGSEPEAAILWRNYLDVLRQHGWRGSDEGIATAPSDRPAPRLRVSPQDILTYLLGVERQSIIDDGPPFPVHINWGRQFASSSAPFTNPDPDFKYFNGIRLITEHQKRFGGKFLFYFSPIQMYRENSAYLQGLEETYGRFLSDHQIPYANHVDLDLKLNLETYDGVHQTIYGNRRIAQTLLQDLIDHHLIK